jgi:hypothetical protein
MGEAQISAWGLYGYGWLCLIFCVVSIRNAINNEVSGRARVSGWAPLAASWMYPALCLLMAAIAWYSAILSQ